MTEVVAQAPRVNRSVDIKTLPLCPEEAFVYSRVDGQTSPKEIALTTGMSTDQVERALDRLYELGALEGWRKSASPGSPRARERAAPARRASERPKPAVAASTVAFDEGFVAVPDLDLSAAEQLRVWRLWKRLDEYNYYELLGLPRDASREQVKSAYFEQVAAFHPDKHFKKTLGTYKEKLEAVFQRLTQAHDTLSRTRRRELYDATLPPSLSPAPDSGATGPSRIPATSTKTASAAEPAATRGAAAPSAPPTAARDSVPPIDAEQRRKMAVRTLERNMRSLAAGERPRTSAPGASPSAPPSSRSMLLDRARTAEREGDFATAASCYETAANGGQDAALFARAAECRERVARATPDDATAWKRAADSARQAVQLAPSNAQLRVLLSRIYAGAGMRASATREAEKAQELSPLEKSVQSWLERLRRGDV